MKKYVSILLAAVFLFGCSANDFLDVIPTGTKIPTTVGDLDKLLNNYNIGYVTWRNTSLMDPDVYLTDQLYNSISTTYQREAYLWKEKLFTVDVSDLDYEYRYKAIYIFNYVLSNIDDAPLEGADTESDRKRIKGEALAQRAFDYFFLVNEYGPHYSAANLNAPVVPMPLENDLNSQLSRSTVGEIYSQIEKDLAEAETLLDNVKAVNINANFRPGKASIKGFRALLALFKGDFEGAASNADQTLAMYSYLYDYKPLNHNTPGNPWTGINIPELRSSDDNLSVIWNRNHLPNYLLPTQLFHPSLVALFDKNNDQRFKLFSSSKDYFSVDVSPNFVYANANVETVAGITSADIYLISAEAHARIGHKDKALQSLNTLLANRILNFVPYQASDFASDSEVLQLVKNERRKELMATAKPWFDLKRYHAYGESVPTFTRSIGGSTVTLEPGSANYVLEISPKIQIMNPNL